MVFWLVADGFWVGLEGCVHVLWRQSVDVNLGEHEVFRHFEEGLGHGTFLRRVFGKPNHFYSHNAVMAQSNLHSLR